MVYLDYNATSPLHPQVERAIKKNLHLFGNPSSQYKFARHAHDAIEEARFQTAAAIQADPTQIIFTSGGTEANNQVLLSTYFQTTQGKKACHLVISSTEHACIRNTTQFMQKLGAKITVIPVNETGRINLFELKKVCETHPVDLISIMLANNETGTLQPIEEVVAIAKHHKIPVHTDAVQAVGKIPVSFQALGVNAMTISGHKLGAPKGSGALIFDQPDFLTPLIHGGPQEKGHRAGTENTLGILGLGVACQVIDLQRETMGKKRDRLWERINATIPDSIQNGDLENRLPNTLNISFLGVKADSVVRNLDREGIAVSTGSACSTGSIDPSPVLMAMGMSEDRIQGAIRFSLGAATTNEEIDYVADTLPPLIARLRKTR